MMDAFTYEVKIFSAADKNELIDSVNQWLDSTAGTLEVISSNLCVEPSVIELKQTVFYVYLIYILFPVKA